MPTPVSAALAIGGLDLSELAWSTWDYAVAGGWVMVPMIIGSVAMWALILERVRTFAALADDDLEAPAALAVLDGAGVPTGRSGLRRLVLERFLAARTGRAGIDRAVLRHVTDRARRQLRGRLPIINALAAVAPLLGLLGTVLGMIETFQVISVFGTSNARAMASGISVALITTETGLLIAIPGLFVSGALMRKAGRLESALDEFSLALDRSLNENARAADLMEAAS
jgi:biopolymer transport protein ExbB